MKTYWQHAVEPIVIGLCFLLGVPIESSAGQQETAPTQLNIIVVEGEGAIHNVQQRVEHEPAIRVEDENHKPVAGAAVVFTLPTEGATGEFGNRSKTLMVMTDGQGQASTQGLRTNQIAGKTSIHVTVSYKGLYARAMISEENVLPPGAKPAAVSGKGGHGKLIAILVIVGAAAAGGAVYATQKGGGSSTTAIIPTGPAAIGITPGTGTIVGGH